MYESLSFVTRTDQETFNFWESSHAANYAAACEVGRQRAVELVAFIEATGDTQVFAAVVRSIAAGGRWDGVEAGFCSEFGITLVGLLP